MPRVAHSGFAPGELSAAHALLDILEQEGVEFIFGVPGGALAGFFEALRARGSIHFVLAKHEGGAAYMAAAYARVSRTLAVCCGTSGPGATNAITGIAGAYSDSVPVLMLSGQVATDVFGKGAIQESTTFGVDTVNLFKPVTKLSTMIPNATRFPALVRSAIRTAVAGRPGPVHLSMPADMLRQRVQHTTIPPHEYRSASLVLDQAGIARAAQLLAEARHPCILAGNGVTASGGAGALLELAREANIPVVTSPKGKGVFPETEPLSLGVLGFGGHPRAEEYFASGDIDVLLVVGSSLNEFVTNAWSIPIQPRTALIQIDIDPTSIAKNYAVDLGIVSDARRALQELALQLRGRRKDVGDEQRRRIENLSGSTPRHLVPESIDSDAVPLKPQRMIRELRAALPDDALLFVDNGNSIIWGTHYFEARRPNTYFADLGLASMGSAVAGVIGGALAAPGRRAVALVGDAAFAMHGFEVHTAVEQRLPVIWLVINNSGHGMVQQGDTLMFGESLRVAEFRVPLDVAATGRAMGARGVRVQAPDELAAALHDALREEEQPTVIDVVIDPAELAPTLVRRVQSLRKALSGKSVSTRPPLGG